MGIVNKNELFLVEIKITRGFRHQIRCHLAWLGFPVLNDDIYGKINDSEAILGLRADGISFSDPNTGEDMHFRLPTLSLPVLDS